MTCNENYFNDFFPLLTRHLLICSLQQLYKSSPYVQKKRSSDLLSHGKCKVVKISTKIFLLKNRIKVIVLIMTKYQLGEKFDFFVEIFRTFSENRTKPFLLYAHKNNSFEYSIAHLYFHLLFFHLSNAYFLKGLKDSWKSIDDNRQ